MLPAVSWLEQRVRRVGAPAGRGPPTSGLSLASAIKLLARRTARPEGADRLLHVGAPALAVLPAAALLALLPLETAAGGAAAHGTLLLALSLPFVSTAAVALAGYAGNNRLALLGALRLVILRASVFVVVATGALGAARAARTLLLGDLVASQTRPLVGSLPALGAFVAPLGFLAAVMGLAVLSQHMSRSRADHEIDLVDPYFVEASGPVLLGFRVFESLELFSGSAFLATLFLGGPWLPGVVERDGATSIFVAAAVLVAKGLLVTALVLAVRRALPPLDHARAVRLCWTLLAPIAAFGLLLSDIATALLASL